MHGTSGGGCKPKTEGGMRALKIAVIVGLPIVLTIIIIGFASGGRL